MIKAKLEALIPSEMRQRIGMDPLSGRDVWDALARRGILPRINGSIPYASELIRWGWLEDGIFLTTAIVKTWMGFTCQITLYSRKTPISDKVLTDWLAANLFRGWAVWTPKPLTSRHVPERYVFDGESNVYFFLENLMQV